MPKDIRVRRGMNLNLKGEAKKELVEAPASKVYSIKPPDFHAMVPKMLIKEGGTITAGEPLFYSKYEEKAKFASPVSGTVSKIVRGAKRRILEVHIESNDGGVKNFGSMDVASADADAIKERLLEAGAWPSIIQRPYSVMADPKDTPKSIFISAYTTAPLAGDAEFIISDRMEEFQAGVTALSKLTSGDVHLCIGKGSQLGSTSNAVIHTVKGAHPAGNVGVQIHNIDPITAVDRVWAIDPENVANIGALLMTGEPDFTRTIAVAGHGIDEQYRKYYRTKVGASVSSLIPQIDDEKFRLISGDVLTGDRVNYDQSIGYYHNTLTVIPEGREYAMFGWLPFTRNNIPSLSGTSLSWLMPNKKYEVNTNLNGEERALVVTGEMEEVVPMDIYPMQLLKACMSGDIEKMESLGIYEVAPEDFALVDYINTSKLEAQQLIRQGLDIMITEVG